MKEWFKNMTRFLGFKNRRLTKFLMFSAACLVLGFVLLIVSRADADNFILASKLHLSVPAGSDLLILLGSGLLGVSVVSRKKGKKLNNH